MPFRTPLIGATVVLLLLSAIFPVSSPAKAAAPDTVREPIDPERGGIPYRDVAGLSDEQIRERYLKELENERTYSGKDAAGGAKGVLVTLLQKLEALSSIFYWRLTALKFNYVKLPHDIGEAARFLANGQGTGRLVGMLAVIASILAAGLGVEWIVRRSTATKDHPDRPASRVEGAAVLLGAMLKVLPDLIGLFISTGIAFVLFVVFFGTDASGLRPLFFAALATVFIARLITALSRVVVSPKVPELRLFPLDDSAAERVHRLTKRFAWTVTTAYITVLLFRYCGIGGDSLILFIIFWGTVVTLMVGVAILGQREFVAARIRGCAGAECDGNSWIMERFAGVWHLLALGYLFLVWFLWSGRLIVQGPQFDTFFLLSLLIVPLFFLLERAGGWLARVLIDSLRSGVQPPENGEVAGNAVDDAASGTETAPIYTIAHRVVRVVVAVVLLFFLLDHFGIELPFIDAFLEASTEITITLVVAYLAWRAVNGYVDRKLAASLPEYEEAGAEGGKEEDDEWGSVASQDRSHTLLPILRKFFAISLLVMVSLIILSSLGLNIGPLLAGAGVVGLAIGFGAQKLVADVLSGLFFLVDDAFRVGEYIEAGGISGVVEGLTLRNAMLRHHRGMLQIVPYSELGGVTNFMRGGIVVKFSLQFPYDTNIDKVRKVIKKVGQQMLLEPEFKDDILKPVKSQGVREVGDSVMTIRVKFTAKPGAHFVIRREAFKRITEALEAKGIQYAHRKVIVEVSPPPSGDGAEAPRLDPKTAESAAAAAESVLAKDRAVTKETAADMDNPFR
jgi:small-conductance mechanosensitive channel